MEGTLNEDMSYHAPWRLYQSVKNTDGTEGELLDSIIVVGHSNGTGGYTFYRDPTDDCYDMRVYPESPPWGYLDTYTPPVPERVLWSPHG